MNGGSTDTSRDHEYTDWAQVQNFAHAFADLFRLRAQVADMARGQGRETPSPLDASFRGAEPTTVGFRERS
jgi:hypothetical protein